jgi:hypothetical protein
MPYTFIYLSRLYISQNPFADGYGIPEACELVLNASSNLAALVNVNAYMSSMFGEFTVTDNRYENLVEFLRDTSWDDTDGTVCQLNPVDY